MNSNRIRIQFGIAQIIVVFSVMTLLISSCKKEEITKVITNDGVGSDVYTFAQSSTVVLDVHAMVNVWTLDEQIGEINIGSLNVGDLVVAETQIRLRDMNDCDSDMRVKTGPRLSWLSEDLPGSGNVIEFDNGSVQFSEAWLADEAYRVFNRTFVVVVDSAYSEVYASLLANTYYGPCAQADAVSAQLGAMVISVYRD